MDQTFWHGPSVLTKTKRSDMDQAFWHEPSILIWTERFNMDQPTRQGSSIVRRIWTWRSEDDLFLARMTFSGCSFTSRLPTNVLRRDESATSILRQRHIRTFVKSVILAKGSASAQRPLTSCQVGYYQDSSPLCYSLQRVMMGIYLWYSKWQRRLSDVRT